MTPKNQAQVMTRHDLPVNNDSDKKASTSSWHKAPPPRSQPLLATLSEAARASPLRKLWKTKSDSDSSAKSSATDITTAIHDDNKRVRFHKKRTYRKTLSLQDYSADEVRATWYAPQDYQRIARQCHKEVRKINKTGERSLKDKKYCARGLEGYTDKLSNRARHRQTSYDAVLEEQLSQWDRGVFDEDAIAKIYIRTSGSCQMWASFVGQQDQKQMLLLLLLDPQSHDDLVEKSVAPGLEKSAVISAAA